MSKKEETKSAEEPKAESKKEKGPPDEISQARKKRKFVLFAGIGGVVAAAAAAGGFFVHKTFGQKTTSLAAKPAIQDSKTPGDAIKADAHSSQPSAGGEAKDGATDGNAGAKPENEKQSQSTESADSKDKNDGKKENSDKSPDAATNKPAGADAADSATGKPEDKTKSDDKTAESKDGKAAESKDGKAAEKSELKMFQSSETFGETFALPKMDLNLGNPLENRYLRIGVSLEYTGGKDQLEELKKREPQLKDIIIGSVSTRTRLELLSDRGKEKLRRELINKINETFERPVKTIYFTDFLVE